MASWLVRSSTDRAVRVQALAVVTVLCSWARHFTLTVPLSTQEYKWVPRIVNQHSNVYCFKSDLCDSNYVGYTTRHLLQRIADHRYSAIGRHLRDAHGNIDLLNESQFRMLKKCTTKWDCLVYEMLYIRTIRPNLNTQSDSIRPKLFV